MSKENALKERARKAEEALIKAVVALWNARLTRGVDEVADAASEKKRMPLRAAKAECARR